MQVKVHESRFNESNVYEDQPIYIASITEDNETINEVFEVPLTSGNFSMSPEDEIAELIALFTKSEESIGPIPLIGDESMYPFDKYYSNLVYVFPLKNISFSNTEHLFSYDGSVTTNWNPYDFESRMNHSNLILTNYNLTCVPEITSLCDVLHNPQGLNDSSLFYVKLLYERNFTIASVIVPILAIFYLLGAIFIFDSSSENISNILTLTLGIFAVIFSLPTIIDSFKPQTSTPTVADSMLSIIIIATISFTVSSVLSSSPILQRWFPKRYSYIDGMVYVIISGFAILYLDKILLNTELWWLVPVIIFGLGYGLLLRLLGIKITGPLFGRQRNQN